MCIKKRVHLLEDYGPWEKEDLDLGWPQELIAKFNYWEEFNLSALDKALVSDEKPTFEPDKIVSDAYNVTNELRQKEYLHRKAEAFRRKAEFYEMICDSDYIPLLDKP